MTLSEKMKNISFFKKRTIIDNTDQDGIGIVGFKENEDDIYSSIVGSPASKSGVIPRIIMISTKGCLVRLDDGEKTILISMPKEDNKEAFSETFSSNLDECEFFQSSLVHDFRHISYDHIEALRQILEIMHDEFPENK